ncbi:hypothetical protein SDC9_142310 [bioreactor metagenome]|uniref:Uncharacterized protein n=1 Tax=bioreactor metagenome TaxID=1076179 RepID=A0A645E0T5_9ZZZZ
MYAVGLQRRNKSARRGFFVKNLTETNRRNQEDFTRLGEARTLWQGNIPGKSGFRFLQRLNDVCNVLLLGLVRCHGGHKGEDCFSGAAVCDGAQREEDGGDHEARFLCLKG